MPRFEFEFDIEIKRRGKPVERKAVNRNFNALTRKRGRKLVLDEWMLDNLPSGFSEIKVKDKVS